MKKLQVLSIVGFTFFANCGQNNPPETLTRDFKTMFEQKIDTATDLLAIFPKTVNDIKTQAERAKAYVNNELDSLYTLKPEQRTFENTIQAFDTIQERFYGSRTALNILVTMSPETTIRDTAQQEMVGMEVFAIDAFLNKKIQQVFKEYADHLGKTEKLDNEQYQLDTHLMVIDS